MVDSVRNWLQTRRIKIRNFEANIRKKWSELFGNRLLENKKKKKEVASLKLIVL